MKMNKEKADYRLENSYIGKLGFKIRSYVPCYSSEDRKKFMREEITKSCLKIYEKIKE